MMVVLNHGASRILGQRDLLDKLLDPPPALFEANYVDRKVVLRRGQLVLPAQWPDCGMQHVHAIGNTERIGIDPHAGAYMARMLPAIAQGQCSGARRHTGDNLRRYLHSPAVDVNVDHLAVGNTKVGSRADSDIKRVVPRDLRNWVRKL